MSSKRRLPPPVSATAAAAVSWTSCGPHAWCQQTNVRTLHLAFSLIAQLVHVYARSWLSPGADLVEDHLGERTDIWSFATAVGDWFCPCRQRGMSLRLGHGGVLRRRAQHAARIHPPHVATSGILCSARRPVHAETDARHAATRHEWDPVLCTATCSDGAHAASLQNPPAATRHERNPVLCTAALSR